MRVCISKTDRHEGNVEPVQVALQRCHVSEGLYVNGNWLTMSQRQTCTGVGELKNAVTSPRVLYFQQSDIWSHRPLPARKHPWKIVSPFRRGGSHAENEGRREQGTRGDRRGGIRARQLYVCRRPQAISGRPHGFLTKLTAAMESVHRHLP